MFHLYACGSNGSGQLAIGHRNDICRPEKILFVDDYPQGRIEQLRAGGNHTLLLVSGKLYSSGNFETGVTASTETREKFSQVRLSNDTAVNSLPIVCCAASWQASIIVQQDENGLSNRLYTIGTGYYGELGQGDQVSKLTEAQLVRGFLPPGLEIIDIAASVYHVVAVLNNGDVYGWGNGRKGQIGSPKQKIVNKPRKITNIGFKIVRALCGREFTCLFGEPESGRFIVLGSDKWNVITSAPTLITDWIDIGAGWGSIHVLKEDGELLSWGRGDHGQLVPPIVTKFLKIAIGSEHALGLTKSGDVLMWGWGEHGNCGPFTSNVDHKNRCDIITASKYFDPKAKFTGIGAGCATSWIYLESSEALT